MSGMCRRSERWLPQGTTPHLIKSPNTKGCARLELPHLLLYLMFSPWNERKKKTPHTEGFKSAAFISEQKCSIFLLQLVIFFFFFWFGDVNSPEVKTTG